MYIKQLMSDALSDLIGRCQQFGTEWSGPSFHKAILQGEIQGFVAIDLL